MRHVMLNIFPLNVVRTNESRKSFTLLSISIFFRKCRKICLTHFRARCVTMGGFPQTKTQKKLHIRRRIALLPFLSKCGVYNVEIINQSRTEFGL